MANIQILPSYHKCFGRRIVDLVENKFAAKSHAITAQSDGKYTDGRGKLLSVAACQLITSKAMQLSPYKVTSLKSFEITKVVIIFTKNEFFQII
jgi:hypothetical protein